MKKASILLFILFLTHSVHAHYGHAKNFSFARNGKENGTATIKKSPASYIGFSSGINNSAGLIGLDFNAPLAKNVTLDAGIGPSTWGNKLFVGSKYYLKSRQRGFAFGGGVTFSSGQENRTARLETISGRERVTLTLKPQMNIFAGAYHYWTLGNKNNRFFTGVGWSVPVTHCRFTQVYGTPLSERGKTMEKRRAPGGLMLSLGFSFAISRR
jgi:hypothetical protein